MTGLYDILEDIRNEAETRIQKELSGFLGIVRASVYNMFMPLVVNVITEDEAYHLTFQRGGTARLDKGSSATPDVTLRSSYSALRGLFQSRSKDGFEAAVQQGDIVITANTPKGQQALSKIKEMFG